MCVTVEVGEIHQGSGGIRGGGRKQATKPRRPKSEGDLESEILDI